MRWGKRLANARRRAGLSQQRVAALAGVPQSTVGRIETGRLEPRAETLDRLLNALGLQLELLPQAGDGVDRTLIAEQRKRSPRERFENAAVMAAFTERLRAGKRR